MALVNSSHDNLNPGLEPLSIKKQLQKVGEGSRDGNTKKYSNKGGEDGTGICTIFAL